MCFCLHCHVQGPVQDHQLTVTNPVTSPQPSCFLIFCYILDKPPFQILFPSIAMKILIFLLPWWPLEGFLPNLVLTLSLSLSRCIFLRPSFHPSLLLTFLSLLVSLSPKVWAHVLSGGDSCSCFFSVLPSLRIATNILFSSTWTSQLSAGSTSNLTRS
jgi:hypothetical protein